MDSITFVLSLLLSVIILGYGLEVTHDLIHDGSHLPNIRLKQSISLGIKFVIVNGAYLITQILILGVISTALDFPVFELEESILHLDEIISLFFSHDILLTVFFIIISASIAYIFTFFMEIGLAKLSDGGKLIDAFNFKEIKRCIDIIGWKKYCIDFTEIILSIVILSYLKYGFDFFHLFDYFFDLILGFFIFIIQFIGIGWIYREYKSRKKA